LVFASDPPVLTPVTEMEQFGGRSRAEILNLLANTRRAYRASLPHARRQLLEQYKLCDVARKVVGVGSVGTRCFVALFSGCDESDLLILQAKEASKSVLEEVMPMSRPFANHGERVVAGQQILQAASDVFLGFSPGLQNNIPDDGGVSRHFYWRQLKDMKRAVNVDELDASQMAQYARVCGWTLARAHAKAATANGRGIAYYLGDDDQFDQAIVAFAEDYADVNELDYRRFLAAIESGEIVAAKDELR
jgi:uncharacterized protein (DUF2252 family)